jgi:hypothetical protein
MINETSREFNLWLQYLGLVIRSSDFAFLEIIIDELQILQMVTKLR